MGRVVPKLVDSSGKPLTCQHFVAGPGFCLDCRSHRVGVGCSRRAVYPDERCALHTEWLKGTHAERNEADNISGLSGPETARARAWQAHHDRSGK